ncbi:hypothetical protein V6D40_00160 [Corynebacterium sp. Q4381]|uniref:hypothetical protein n=1 Tax=Corynebacterium sp. Marseille-Q4381 TaxID=3121597 RepID=UPI002FE6644F
MGRHSSGKNNYALSGGAVFALVAALLLVGGAVWFAANRGDDEAPVAATDEPCVLGDLALPVATANPAVAAELIGAYAASKPTVREYCIQPVVTDSLEDAAVYLAPATAITHQELAEAQRTAAVANPATVYADPVGVSGAVKAERPDVQSVSFPTGTAAESAASAVVAFVLAGGPNEAVEALTNQRGAGEWVAASGSNAPEGREFTPLEASVEYAAIPLNAAGTVDENQARAAQDFARFAAERFEPGQPAQPLVPELVWAAALPSGGATITDGDVYDTLFVLDTSDAMAPFMAAAEEAVGTAARGVAADGHAVGLWNYSSPLSPGVEKGYRRNVALAADGEEVARVVTRFTTGGQPQTREALRAAVAALADADGTTRIVLITTGTADAAESGDDAFVEEIRAAAGDAVEFSVVHVGDLAKDQALQSLADIHLDVEAAQAAENLPRAVREAAGLRD